MPIIPILLLGAPILEIAVLILVGEQIGLLPTLGIVVGSALVGAILLRRQGFAALSRIRAETAAGRVPGRDIVHGVMILLAGILLLLPGLIGDVIGVLLFLPPVRDLLWRALGRSVTVVATTSMGTPMGFQRFGRGMPSGARPRTPQPGVLDLDDEDYHRRADPNAGPNSAPNSPWAGDGEEPGKRTLH